MLDPAAAFTVIRSTHEAVSWTDFVTAKAFYGSLLVLFVGSMMWVLASNLSKVVIAICGLATATFCVGSFVVVDHVSRSREVSYASIGSECSSVAGAISDGRMRMISLADAGILREACGIDQTVFVVDGGLSTTSDR